MAASPPTGSDAEAGPQCRMCDGAPELFKKNAVLGNELNMSVSVFLLRPKPLPFARPY